MKKINIDLLQTMLKPKTSGNVMFDSFKELKPTKENIKKNIAFCVIAFVPSLLIGCSENTVSIFKDSVGIINDMTIAIYGIVFTGYVFFQALINNELLVRMLNDKVRKNGEERSKLQETNEEFVHLMMLCVFSLVFNLFLILCIGAVSNDFTIFRIRIYNNVIAIILLELYFFFSFTIVWETKSFIFNIFQLFQMHAGTRILELINEDKENDNDKN